MFFTPEKLFEIKQIIADYHNAFILNALGEAAVSPEILARLKDLGLVDPQVNSIEEA